MQNRKSVFRSLAMVSQLGLCVLTPLLLAVAVGTCLEAKTGIRCMLPLILLGVLGGARGAFLMTERLLRAEDREQAEREKKAMEEVLAGAQASPAVPKRAGRVGIRHRAEGDEL